MVEKTKTIIIIEKKICYNWEWMFKFIIMFFCLVGIVLVGLIISNDLNLTADSPFETLRFVLLFVCLGILIGVYGSYEKNVEREIKIKCQK